MSSVPSTPALSEEPAGRPVASAGSRKVFLSYSHLDSALATSIHDHLSALPLSLNVWMAEIDAHAHEQYNRQVTAALTEADAFLLLLTPHSNRSQQVESEVGHAFTQKKPIVVLCVDGERPGDTLSHFIGLYNWKTISSSLTQADRETIETAVADAVDMPSSQLATRDLQMKRSLWQTIMSSSRTVKVVSIVIAVVSFIAAIAQIWGVWFMSAPVAVPVQPAAEAPFWTHLSVHDVIDRNGSLSGWIALDNIDREVFVGQSIKPETSPTPAGKTDYVVFIDSGAVFESTTKLGEAPIQWKITEPGSLTMLLVRADRPIDAELKAFCAAYGTRTPVEIDSSLQIAWKDDSYELVETHTRAWEKADKPRISDFCAVILRELGKVKDIHVTGRTIGVRAKPADPTPH